MVHEPKLRLGSGVGILRKHAPADPRIVAYRLLTPPSSDRFGSISEFSMVSRAPSPRRRHDSGVRLTRTAVLNATLEAELEPEFAGLARLDREELEEEIATATVALATAGRAVSGVRAHIRITGPERASSITRARRQA
jgi:hypothetical protein